MEAQTETRKTYIITPELRTRFVGIVLINEIINFQKYFPVTLQQDDIYLGDYLKNLATNGFLEISKGQYIPTQKGREYLQTFYNKYYEYLKIFDIFCAVDLDRGEFAFSSINSDMNDSMDDDQWNSFLIQERFSDVRVAVAEFKKMDPLEIVFMSFLNEGRFDLSKYRWQYNLTGDDVWIEIANICNTAISCEYLLKDDVIQDVIKQGTEIALQLIKVAEESNSSQEQGEIIEETTTETVEEYVDVVEMPYYGYDYFDPYYDPYYISPLWIPIVLLF